jgi:hypothetical protein
MNTQIPSYSIPGMLPIETPNDNNRIRVDTRFATTFAIGTIETGKPTPTFTINFWEMLSASCNPALVWDNAHVFRTPDINGRDTLSVIFDHLIPPLRKNTYRFEVIRQEVSKPVEIHNYRLILQ